MKTKSQRIIQFITALYLTSFSLTHCPSGSVMKVESDFSVSCLKCSEGCAICTLNSNAEQNCIFCEDGYFHGRNNYCTRCFENCASCIGPEMNQCRSLIPGFYYNSIQMRINPCSQTGCSSCNSDGSCNSCKEGYLMSNTTTSEKNTCKYCEIDNCIICGEKSNEISGLTYMSCRVCKSGYYLNGGKCNSCIDNCQFCVEESGECILCKNGFNLSQKQNECQATASLNCVMLDSENKCISCENRFYLKDEKCYPCQKSVSNCSICKVDPSNLMFQCVSCPEKCHLCSRGFFYNEDTKTCEVCDIKNCESCRTSALCESCEAGFYLEKDTNICQPLIN